MYIKVRTIRKYNKSKKSNNKSKKSNNKSKKSNNKSKKSNNKSKKSNNKSKKSNNKSKKSNNKSKKSNNKSKKISKKIKGGGLPRYHLIKPVAYLILENFNTPKLPVYFVTDESNRSYDVDEEQIVLIDNYSEEYLVKVHDIPIYIKNLLYNAKLDKSKYNNYPAHYKEMVENLNTTKNNFKSGYVSLSALENLSLNFLNNLEIVNDNNNQILIDYFNEITIVATALIDFLNGQVNENDITHNEQNILDLNKYINKTRKIFKKTRKIKIDRINLKKQKKLDDTEEQYLADLYAPGSKLALKFQKSFEENQKLMQKLYN